MPDKTRLKESAIISYINMVVTIVSSFALVPIMNDAWGAQRYGLYGLIGSLIAYVSLLDFGLGDCIMRYVAKYRAMNDRKAQDNFVNMCFSLYLCMSVAAFIIGLIIYRNIDFFFTPEQKTPELISLAQKMFMIILVNLSVSFLFQVFPGILSAYERFMFTRRLELIRNIIRPVLAVALVYARFSPVSIVLLDTALNMLYYICVVFYCFRYLNIRITLRGIDYSILKELMNYSFFVFLGYIVNQLYWKTDGMIIGKFYGLEEVPVSTNGSKLANYFIQISLTLATLFLPRVTKLVVKDASGKELTDIMIKVGRI